MDRTDPLPAGEPCGVPWPVCPDCLGQGLSLIAGRAVCPRCDRAWDQGAVIPCPWPRAAELVDSTGARLSVCASHAAHPSGARLRGSTAL
jgi:hypothetical protein